MAARIVEQLECTVPGTVHSLRLDTFSSHMRVDIVLNRDRLGGRGSGEGGVGDDAGAPAGASEEAQRPWRRSHSTAATAAQPSRASRQPPPPAGRRPQRQQQPSQTHKVTSAPQERTAPATAPERTAAVEPSTAVPHEAASAAPAQAGPPFCHDKPSRNGRPPRVPTTVVGKAVSDIRFGVRALAPAVDEGLPYNPDNYYTGKISIDGVMSQDVTVPRGSACHYHLASDPEDAGLAMIGIARYCERTADSDYQAEVRKFLMPGDMSESEDPSERNSGSDPSEPGSD